MAENKQTSKGRGRPKKGAKGFNFCKGRKLNFDMEDSLVVFAIFKCGCKCNTDGESQIIIEHQLSDIEFSYDTSFLRRLQVVINGDVESNPGPIASALSHRIAIGRYYSKAVYLSSGLYTNIEVCSCQKYEESIYKHSGYNFLTMIEMFDNNLLEKQN